MDTKKQGSYYTVLKGGLKPSVGPCREATSSDTHESALALLPKTPKVCKMLAFWALFKSFG